MFTPDSPVMSHLDSPHLTSTSSPSPSTSPSTSPSPSVLHDYFHTLLSPYFVSDLCDIITSYLHDQLHGWMIMEEALLQCQGYAGGCHVMCAYIIISYHVMTCA